MIRKLSLLFVALLTHILAFAQFDVIEVGINGLTCSMCSYSVENSIRKIQEVDKISMDLNNNIAFVYFKRNSAIDFNLLAERVRNSGFSVRHISFTLSKPVTINQTGIFETGSLTFQCINTSSSVLSPGSRLRLMGKEFMSKTEYKEVQTTLKSIKKPSGQDILLVNHEE